MVPRLLTLPCFLLPFLPPFQQASFAQRSGAAVPDSGADPCLLTKPSTRPFVSPLPYSARTDPKVFWYGTDELWTSLPTTGRWSPPRKLDPRLGLRLVRTVPWWRQAYWNAESEAKLIVTGRRLDSPAPPPVEIGRYGGWLEEHPLVNVNLRFPTPGCWEVTGRYEDQELSFVIWVTQ